MNLDFDLTFVLQMAVFAGLIVLLGPILFEPVLRVFQEREQRTEGAKANARRMQEEAGDLKVRHDKELSRVHEVARREREASRAETARLEAQLLAEARESANAIVEQGREELEKERQKVVFSLGQQSEKLARQIAETVLGRSLH